MNTCPTCHHPTHEINTALVHCSNCHRVWYTDTAPKEVSRIITLENEGDYGGPPFIVRSFNKEKLAVATKGMNEYLKKC